MSTKSIKVKQIKYGIVATIIIQDSRGNVYESYIRNPSGEQPFYLLDGKRHDLTEHEIKRLREAIKEVRNG